MPLEVIPEILRSLPGALGSLVSMVFLKESHWLRKLILFLGGWGFSAGSQETVSDWVHLKPGFVLAFLLGLGSMAVFAKLIETWQEWPLAAYSRDVVRKWSGLPPVNGSSTRREHP